MADSASELESDASSVDGGPVVRSSGSKTMAQLKSRIESLEQENCVLKMELDTTKLKCKQLQEDNRELRKASVTIQARAEQEEEYISNTLLKKINALKKEKEKLAMNYEQEEEYLTNDLSRKLQQLRQEKLDLEQNLAREQENQVSKLMKRIERLESDTMQKQQTLEQLRREKVELENCLEQEQEALVNKLWKKMEKLETEKRMLQEKLEQPVSAPSSPRSPPSDGDIALNLSTSIQSLRQEVVRLRSQLSDAQNEHKERMAQYEKEERQIREQNLRLQRKLQMEIERREQLCRHLSESESSLEMDDERMYNEMAKHQDKMGGGGASQSVSYMGRARTVSSPVNIQSPGSSRPLSPSMAGFSGGPLSPSGSLGRNSGSYMSSYMASTSPPSFSHMPAHTMAYQPHAYHATTTIVQPRNDKFAKPYLPCTTSNYDRLCSTSQNTSQSVSQSSSQSSLQGDKRAPPSPMQVERPAGSPADRHTNSPGGQSPSTNRRSQSPMQPSTSPADKRSQSPMQTDK